MKVDLPYVQAYWKNGVFFTYYRRDGRLIRIRGDFDTPDWHATYRKIHDTWGAEEASPHLSGTLRWLIQRYKESPRWKRLKPATRASYDRYLSELDDAYGIRNWSLLRRSNVIELRDKHQDSPRRANYYLQLLSILGEVAIDRDIRTDNPAKGIEKLQGGAGWRAWEPEELLWFEGAARNAACRLAYYLALFTGQREGDVLSMTWNAVRDGAVEVMQQKTGARVVIPLHPVLSDVLSETAKRGMFIVCTEAGAQYTTDGFKTMWRREILSCGLDGVQFHGLRKNASGALAEAGCTDEEIMSITGHKTRSMISLYTRYARQKLLAQSAMRKMANRTQ